VLFFEFIVVSIIF